MFAGLGGAHLKEGVAQLDGGQCFLFSTCRKVCPN